MKMKVDHRASYFEVQCLTSSQCLMGTEGHCPLESVALDSARLSAVGCLVLSFLRHSFQFGLPVMCDGAPGHCACLLPGCQGLKLRSLYLHRGRFTN